jgi:hypothetical protein
MAQKCGPVYSCVQLAASDNGFLEKKIAADRQDVSIGPDAVVCGKQNNALKAFLVS